MESRDAHGSHCEEQGWVRLWKHSLSRCRQPSLRLLGLSKSFSSTQILMLHPLPPISKVFTLVVQEEHQRFITHGKSPLYDPLVVQDSNPPATIATTVGNSKSKRNRPLSHCGI
ncbi:hypothetical protein AAG906_003082 [Vitis piasezkii]